MPKITKITTGEANFVLEEVFDNEEKATEGTDPSASEVTKIDIKIDNTKWRKSDE